MNREDINGFLAEEEDVIRDDHLFFTYSFETKEQPQFVAAGLASEMSTAQWKRPGVVEDFRPTYAAKVVHLEVMETVHRTERAQRVVVRIAYPHINFGTRIPNLLTVACGEGAFHAPHISMIKLLDIEFPENYLEAFSGPRFGIEGLRGLLHVYDRPIFFGVVKPNIGLSPHDFSTLAYEAWCGGLDIAKDDEMLCDTEWSPLVERCRIVGRKCKEAEQKTGEKKIYLANITDEVDRLAALHDIAVKEGAGAVMVNGLTTGLSAVRALAKHASVPIVGHFDMLAPLSRLPFFGVSTIVLTKLQRLSGCDVIIMPGFGSRMMMEEDEVLDNVDACAEHFGNLKRALPAPGGSDSAVTLPHVYQKLRTIDFGFVPGRGVFGHPLGPRAGAASLRQAWQAIASDTSLEAFARHSPELAAACDAFGASVAQKKTTKSTTPITTRPLEQFLSAIHHRAS